MEKSAVEVNSDDAIHCIPIKINEIQIDAANDTLNDNSVMVTSSRGDAAHHSTSDSPMTQDSALTSSNDLAAANAPLTTRWRKILYIKQPFPDNYVDETFLEELQKNGTVHFILGLLILDFM